MPTAPHVDYVELRQLSEHRVDDTLPTSTESEYPASDSPVPTAHSGAKLAYYPLSLIIFLLWAVFTAILILLLELSAAAAPTSVNPKWYYAWLPGVLLTVFAQGHVAVTGIYLGRLAMSSLHIHGCSPASWAELFWQADRSWEGPIGILSMMYDNIKMRAKLSYTIIMFVITCMIATITPVLLSRAYPLTTIDVAVQTTRDLNVFWPPQMLAFDLYAQVASGGGAWATGMSVLNVYNSSVFIPPDIPRVDSQTKDIFFTGDTLGTDAKLEGVRTRGKCQALNSGPVDHDVFMSQMCEQLPAASQSSYNATNLTWWSTDTSLSWCSTYADFGGGLMKASDSSTYASALLWLNMSSQSLDSTVQGVVMCNVTFSTGSAVLNGHDRTFVDFQEAALYDPAKAQAGESLMHPLNAALRVLAESFMYIQFGPPSIVTILGYTSSVEDNNLVWALPSLDDVAERLWQGSAHMGSAIGLLSQQSGHAYPVTLHVSVAGRKINSAMAKIAWILVVVWFLLLLGCTFVFFKPTFSSSLNAYVAARLLVEHPALVEGYCFGSLDDNMEMRARFDTIEIKEIVGHVTPRRDG